MSRRLNQHGNFSWYHEDERRELPCTDYQRAAEVGALLWRENVASVLCRYSHTPDDLPGTAGDAASQYRFSERDARSICFVEIDPVQVIKACDCYDYQSCEHDEWETSEAKTFTETLRRAAAHAVAGYDDAKWGAPEPTAGAICLAALIPRKRRAA